MKPKLVCWLHLHEVMHDKDTDDADDTDEEETLSDEATTYNAEAHANQIKSEMEDF